MFCEGNYVVEILNLSLQGSAETVDADPAAADPPGFVLAQ